VAASHLGERRLRDAIPHLINLLHDKEVYKTVVQTHPETEEDVLVRDVAIEALEDITGMTLARRGSRDEQVKAWLRWWQRR
jgi:hypothetical protein